MPKAYLLRKEKSPRSWNMILFTFILTFSACAGLGADKSDRYVICERLNETVLKVAGPTDLRMSTCISQNLDKRLEAMVLTSHGGSALHAMEIGDLVAARQLTFIISDICASSCANYLLPLADEIYVSADSLIMLHGSVDDGFIDNSRGTLSERDIRTLETLRDQQTEYARKHKIPRAWLLERDIYAPEASRITGLIGKFADFHHSGSKRSKLLPGPDFIKSCFPNMQITFSNDALPIKAMRDNRLARSLAKQGYFSSGTARCQLEGIK